MTTKLESIAECRGYLGHFIGRERADAMNVAELAAAARQHGAELAPSVVVAAPAAPARADSVYREDTKAAPRDKRADAFTSSFCREGESLSAYAERTRRDAAAQPKAPSKGKPDKRAAAYTESWSWNGDGGRRIS